MGYQIQMLASDVVADLIDATFRETFKGGRSAGRQIVDEFLDALIRRTREYPEDNDAANQVAAILHERLCEKVLQ